MIHLEETDNGLVITLTDRDELLESIARNQGSDAVLYDALDYSKYLGNDWWALTASDIMALSEAPCIGYGAIWEDENAEQPSDFDTVWAFNDYQVKNWYDDLLEFGSVTFTKM